MCRAHQSLTTHLGWTIHGGDCHPWHERATLKHHGPSFCDAGAGYDVGQGLCGMWGQAEETQWHRMWFGTDPQVVAARVLLRERCGERRHRKERTGFGSRAIVLDPSDALPLPNDKDVDEEDWTKKRASWGTPLLQRDKNHGGEVLSDSSSIPDTIQRGGRVRKTGDGLGGLTGSYASVHRLHSSSGHLLARCTQASCCLLSVR